MANAPSMQGQMPQPTDKKYQSATGFNQMLYQSDLMKWQQSLSSGQIRPDGSGGTLKDIYSTLSDGGGAGDAPAPGPAGIGGDVTGQKDQGGLLPGHPNYGGPGQPSKGGTSPTAPYVGGPNQGKGYEGITSATPGPQSSPASSTPTSGAKYQRSPDDDITNDGGSNWSLGPGWKAVTDPELKHWSPEHQAAAQAAHDAHDEAGFNGVKDYVRGERATGGSNYRGGANAGYNPNNTPDSSYAGMSLRDVLQLGGNQDYYGELSGFSNQDQQDWITAYMRGATAQGQQIVDKNRKKP